MYCNNCTARTAVYVNMEIEAVQELETVHTEVIVEANIEAKYLDPWLEVWEVGEVGDVGEVGRWGGGRGR